MSGDLRNVSEGVWGVSGVSGVSGGPSVSGGVRHHGGGQVSARGSRKASGRKNKPNHLVFPMEMKWSFLGFQDPPPWPFQGLMSARRRRDK